MKRTECHPLTLVACILALMLPGCSDPELPAQQTVESVPGQSAEDAEDEVWKMEKLYWQYVQNNDTISYKTLWHDDFIGYPSFGDGVSGKDGIAIWIPVLHKDTNRIFSYQLHQLAVNAIDDVVIAFYDADDIRTDQEDHVVSTTTFKFTHTWKKINGKWVILGGMAAVKNQEVLN